MRCYAARQTAFSEDFKWNKLWEKLITYFCFIRHGPHRIWLTHSWSWALLEKPPIVQLLKNFPAFYGTRRFITVFKRALHWSLSWARSIQSIPSYPISLRSILILFTHLHLGLPSGLFPSGSPTNILYAFHREWRIQQFVCCCVCIHCQRNVLAKTLPSNDRGIHIQTHRQQGDLISLLL
jgi:hypothetical protein